MKSRNPPQLSVKLATVYQGKLDLFCQSPGEVFRYFIYGLTLLQSGTDESHQSSDVHDERSVSGDGTVVVPVLERALARGTDRRKHHRLLRHGQGSRRHLLPQRYVIFGSGRGQMSSSSLSFRIQPVAKSAVSL